MFINVELGIHLERPPEGYWMAMDATTRLGPSGAGLCTSVLSDERGRVGRFNTDFTRGETEVESPLQ